MTESEKVLASANNFFLVIRISSFIRHLSFVIRHCTPTLRSDS
jgi:hypothetical protein